MVTRVMAASVRLAVPAIPIALMLGIPVWAAILLLAAGTALYTYLGGLKAVIWIDVIQVLVYLSGAVIALVFILDAIPGGLSHLIAAGGGVRLVDTAFDLSKPYTLWAGILGGSFLAMASHGADQLIVQRLLACRGLRDAQRALIGSGVVVIAQFALFLTIGVALAAFFAGRPIDPSGLDPLAFHSSDEIFPAFIVRHLPPIASAYLVAGIFSAAMCSESSALNSLASALAHDIVAPLFGKQVLDGARGPLARTAPHAHVDARPRRPLGRLQPPRTGRARRAGRPRPRERDGGRPPRGVPHRALPAARDAGRRAPRDRDLGCRDARDVARLEGAGSPSRSRAGSPGRGTRSSAARSRSRWPRVSSTRHRAASSRSAR